MSEFFRALGQAERDRALREQGKSGRQPQPPVEEPPVVEEPVVEEPVVEEAVVETEEVRTPVAARVARATSAFLRKPMLTIPRREAPAPIPVDPELEGLDSHF